MLTDLDFELEYRTGENDPLVDCILPAMAESNTYWRAAGFFSSSSFDMLTESLEKFLMQDGYMKLVTSLHLSQKDKEAIKNGIDAREVMLSAIDKIVEEEFTSPLAKGPMLLYQLIKHNRIEIQLAVRDNGKLYHEKLGLFFDENEDYIAFTGSQNESQNSLKDTFESIDVYTSWGSDKLRAERKKNYFERLWENKVKKLEVIRLPKGIERVIIREGKKTEEIHNQKDITEEKPTTEKIVSPVIAVTDDRYDYQEDAIEWFLDPQKGDGAGIYWMATGTGKTITALKTAKKLFAEELISNVVLVASNRLLKQWDKEMKKTLPDGSEATPWLKMQFWHTSSSDKQEALFRQLLGRRHGICLMISYNYFQDFLYNCSQMNVDLQSSLLIVDEVHNIGRRKMIELVESTDVDEDHLSLDGDSSSIFDMFGFRLGLSATPLSDFDDSRNNFLLSSFCKNPPLLGGISEWEGMSVDSRRAARLEILRNNEVVFHIGLAEAINRGVLVEFSYYNLDYEPTEEEKDEKLRVMRLWKKKIADGEAAPGTDRIMMAKVFKSSVDKLRAFEEYLQSLNKVQLDNLFARALVFVDNKEFGRNVGRILHKFDLKYHEYFNTDDEDLIEEFSEEKLDLLITCHMISEGVDIRSISSIILFSSDRQRLETVQRIGRALRKDPTRPDKKAKVLDFTYFDNVNEDSSDAERYRWLSELSLETFKGG